MRGKSLVVEVWFTGVLEKQINDCGSFCSKKIGRTYNNEVVVLTEWP